MAIEAYKIFIELLTEAPLGPLNDMLRVMAQVQKAQQQIQTGINDMAAGLRGSTRLAENLARAMQGVAQAAKDAAASSRNIRTAGGIGGAAGAGGGSSYSSPARAAASAQLLLTGPRPAPLALPYSGSTSGIDVTGRTPWPGPSNGFTLMGAPRGPGSSLVPSGPRMDRTDATGRSPDRGMLVPPGGGGGGGYDGGGSYVPPDDEPYSPRRPTLNPNAPKAPKSHSAMNFVAAAATGTFVGGALYEGTKALLDPSYQLAQETQRVAAETRQPAAGVQPIVRQAFDLQRSVLGTNVIGNLEAYRMLYSLTQSQAEAKVLLPTFLPVGTALNMFNPYGGPYNEQLESVFKSAEFLGAVSKTDPKTGKTSVDASAALKVGQMLLQFETVSNGAVDPAKFLSFLRSGGSAAANMNLAEMAYLLPAIQSLNPRGAGQGLKSFEQQFSSGKMSQGVLEMLTEMGIVKNPGLVRKIGIGQFMLKPGALDEKVLLQAVQDPVDFYKDTLLPGVDKYLDKSYGKKFTGADVKQRQILEGVVLQQLSSRIPGGTLLNEMLRIGALSIRDAAAVSKSSQFNLVKTLNEAPLIQIESFSGALNAMLAVFASPALKGALTGIGWLTDAMNALTKAGQNHPTAAADAATIAGQAGSVRAGVLTASILRTALNKAGKVGLGATVGGVAGAASTVADALIAREAGYYLADEGLKLLLGPQSLAEKQKANSLMSSWLPPGLSGIENWFKRQIGDSIAPRGAPPAPIATAAHPLPVTVVNGKDLMQSVDAHNAKQMSLPPSSQTGASFGASPAWAGVPGFAP